MFTTTRLPLGQVVLRYAGFVQGLVALPCMIQLVCSAYLYWFHQYDVWYWFTTYTLAASACGGIIFTAAVQWKALTTNFQTWRLEVLKSVLATGLFIWVNFKNALGTPQSVFSGDWKRLILTGLAVLVLFYAPLGYAYVAWKDDQRREDAGLEENRGTGYTDAMEKTPLLQSQH